MQIKNVLQGANPYGQKKIDKAGKTGSEKSQALGREGSDKVSFSSAGVLRNEAATTARESEGLRTDRIAELKKQIADGTYEINPRKIAENLVKEDLELLL